MKVPSNLHIDNPAYPLLQGLTTYWGTTSAAGNAFGTTLQDARCSTAGLQPSYVGQSVRLLSGNAAGQTREISVHALATGIITVASAFTDYNGAVYQVPAGTLFCIIPAGGGGGAGPVGPSIGLWMFGICDPAMVASTTTLQLTNLAGFPDDLFNDDFYIEVLRNDNNVGLAPEHEIRLVTDYVGATGMFTCNAFSANVEADDLVAVIHHSLIGPELNVISALVRNIFDIVNAGLVTTETGGTLTADGTEQDVYINNAPASVYEPLIVNIDCTNMAAGDSVILRVYYRIAPGGNMIKKDQITLNGDQDPDLKNVILEPNRYGVQVTLEQTAGVNRDFDWEAIYRG